MKISFNGRTFDNIGWSKNTLTMETDMTLAEIENIFAPGAELQQIVISEGDSEVARYYNKSIDSLRVTGTSPRAVEVVFNLTQIDSGAESEIRESVEYSDEAIEELAAIVAEFAESDFLTMYNEIKAFFATRMREEQGIFNAFDIRIRALEENAGIASITVNEEA